MMTRAAGILLLLVVLSGCSSGGGTAINYYLIDPAVTSPIDGVPAQPLSIEVLDISLPQYLERFQIASRTGANQLTFSENNQWGENLRKNLLRTMTRNLGVALGTADIATPLSRLSSAPDFRIQVYIEQFERENEGHMRLVARWQLSDAAGHSLAIHAVDLSSPDSMGATDFPGMVEAQQVLFATLCRQIAESLVHEESN